MEAHCIDHNYEKRSLVIVKLGSRNYDKRSRNYEIGIALPYADRCSVEPLHGHAKERISYKLV